MKKMICLLSFLVLFSGFFKTPDNKISHEKLGNILISYEKDTIIKNVFSVENKLTRKAVFSKNRNPIFIEVYDEKGNLKEKTIFSNKGKSISYFHSNGIKYQTFYFDNNNNIYKNSFYHDNGALASEGFLKSNWQRTGNWKSFDSSGNQTEQIEYQDNGDGYFYNMENLLIRKDLTKTGGIIHQWLLPNGSISNQVDITFANQSSEIVLFQTFFHENGQIKENGYLTPAWQRTGEWEFYDETGTLIEKKKQGA